MKGLYEKYIATFVDALVEEIKSKGVIKSTLKSSKILNSGGGRIPNIRDLRIDLGSYNKILKLVGLDVKEGTTLKFEKLNPDRMNRFMIYQLGKLSYYRDHGKYKKFFKLAFALIRRSVSFRVSAINHVFFNGYKKYPLGGVLRVNRKADKILASGTTLLNFTRVYIPKPGKDSFRPLGVPAPEGRLVLHMVNNMIHGYLRDFVLNSQHGFIPGRGTLSAGKQMFQDGLLDKPFIYEADLKQFFPSVNLDALNALLLRLKVPTGVVKWLDGINSNFPRLPEDVKLAEDKQREEDAGMKALDAQFKAADPRPDYEFGNPRFKKGIELDIKTRKPATKKVKFVTKKGVGNYPNHHLEEVVTETVIDTGEFLPFEEIEAQLPPRRRRYPRETPKRQEGTDLGLPASKYYLSRVGVPQGAPTSPFLSILILKDFLSQQLSVSYADDMIFFGDSEFKVYDYPDKGITLHREKSGGVKGNGQWLKPLKFLGLEFDGKVLSANTRNGSKLVLTKDIRNAIVAINQLEQEMYRDVSNKKSEFVTSKDRVLDNGYNLFKSRLIGHLVSRLYIGKGNQEDLEQDFMLKFVSTSGLDIKWANLKATKGYTIFNASSYASWSLAEILRNRYRRKRSVRRD